MSRFNRINIDGESLFKTETRKVADEAGILPGTFVTISADGFTAATAGTVGRVYVLDPAVSEGLRADDIVPAGHSTSANYLEEGRELAVLVAAGAYTKDASIAVGDSGVGVLAEANVVAYSQETVTLSEAALLRVRVRSGVQTYVAPEEPVDPEDPETPPEGT